MIVRVECPQCKQVSEVPFKRAFDIYAKLAYIGTGEYVPEVDEVFFDCSGCGGRSRVDIKPDCEVGDDGPFI